MQTIADGLYEQWRYGNRKNVITEVLRTFYVETPSEKAVRSALLAALLTAAMDTEERMVFFSMLKERMGD